MIARKTATAVGAPQQCECGDESYQIWLINSEAHAIGIVAACVECGRITGTVGEGPRYRGMNISELQNEETNDE